MINKKIINNAIVGTVLLFSGMSIFAQNNTHMIDKDLNVEFYAKNETTPSGAYTGTWDIIFANNDSTPITIKSIQSVKIKTMDSSIFSHTPFPKGEITLDIAANHQSVTIKPSDTQVFQYNLSQYFNKSLHLPRSVYQQRLEIELVLSVQANKNQILNKSMTYALPIEIDTRKMAY